MSEKRITWGGLASSWVAGRLIAKGEPFSLLIEGTAAEALRKVLGPTAQLSREMLATVAGNLSLATLPALMLYALGRGYGLHHESAEGGAVRMRFVSPAAATVPPGDGAETTKPERDGSV